eukprot:5040464-Amphidinium_carterae.1
MSTSVAEYSAIIFDECISSVAQPCQACAHTLPESVSTKAAQTNKSELLVCVGGSNAFIFFEHLASACRLHCLTQLQSDWCIA